MGPQVTIRGNTVPAILRIEQPPKRRANRAPPLDCLNKTAMWPIDADVCVFAVQTAQRHIEYDPLDVSQWHFYVLPCRAVESIGYKSISLPTLMSAAGAPTLYPQLADAIALAAATNADTLPAASLGPQSGV